MQERYDRYERLHRLREFIKANAIWEEGIPHDHNMVPIYDWNTPDLDINSYHFENNSLDQIHLRSDSKMITRSV